MDAAEYLAFLPLLFYGIALSDLVSEWKRFIDWHKLFAPYAILTVVFTESALYNVFIFAEVINDLEGLSYINYIIYLIPSFLFMFMVNIFTPTEGADTEEYFRKQRFLVCFLFSAFILSHFLFEFNEFARADIIRIVASALLVFIGLHKKNWSIYLLFVVWLVMWVEKSNVIST